jgi:hypothetical protein
MSFVAIVNPNGGVVYRRDMKEPFSNDHLLERILCADTLVGLSPWNTDMRS